MNRLFQAATTVEWDLADQSRHLDVWQLIDYLLRGESQMAKIPVKFLNREQIREKRKRINEYARRRGLSVCTRYRDGWILVRNDTEKRHGSANRRGRPLR